jgi:hypothetical protein
MRRREFITLPSPAVSNTLVINARSSLQIEADQRVVVVAGLPVHHSRSFWVCRSWIAAGRQTGTSPPLVHRDLSRHDRRLVVAEHGPRGLIHDSFSTSA